MAEKDITEKMLADYNDVFADIVNVLLFDGEMIVEPDSLESVKDKSQLKIANEIHEEERDITKVLKSNNIRISLIGLEHQTTVDKDESFRVMAYDGASYKGQLLGNQKERYPVVTLVLYFGTTHWNQPLSLWDSLDIREEWKPYVNDYRVNLFEIAFLTPEQVRMFKSDFRIVADYFVQLRTNKNYKPSKEEFVHIDEILKLMTVLTKDNRFTVKQNEKQGGAKNMCEVFDIYENRGLQKGRMEGKREGKLEGKLEGKIEAYLDMGMSIEVIAQKLGMSVEEVQDIAAALGIDL